MSNSASLTGLPCGVDPVHIVIGEIHHVLTALRLSGRRWSVPPQATPNSTAIQPSQTTQQQTSPSPETTPPTTTIPSTSLPPSTAPTTSSQQQPIESVDDSLMVSELHELLLRIERGGGDINSIEPISLLQPFLDVIQCEHTNAAVTGVALSSVFKLLSMVIPYQQSKQQQPNSSLCTAMGLTAKALARCKFEAGELDSDQATLSKLLRLILSCVQLPIGCMITDNALVELFEACFRVAVPHRRQTREVIPLLRSLAENTLLEFVQSAFSRISPATKSCSTSSSQDLPYSTVGLLTILQEIVSLLDISAPNQIANSLITPTPTPEIPQINAIPQNQANTPTITVPSPPPPQQQTIPTNSTTPNILLLSSSSSSSSSSSLPMYAQQLGSMLSPKRRIEAQFLALNMVSAIIEVSGKYLASLSDFKQIFEKDLPFAILQLLNSSQPVVFALALRVLVNMFSISPVIFKMHLEMFLVTCFKLALDSQGNHTKQSELILQTILELIQDKAFVVEIYANYDCDLYCTNLLGNLSEFLYKAAFPRDGSFATAHNLALNAILILLSSLSRCIEMVDTSSIPQKVSQQQSESSKLRRTKQRKRVLMQIVEAFNKSSAEGIKAMKEQGLIQDPINEKTLALFLRSTPGFNKSILGEFLSDKKEFNMKVLDEFNKILVQSSIDLPFVAAVRRFMESFVMEGDANVIGRVLEAYANEYFTQQSSNTSSLNPCIFKDSDAVYVAMYSVVLLNVDLHNAALKSHMSLEDYIKNARGINKNEDLPRGLLMENYMDIRSNPFKIPEDFPTGNITQRACVDMASRGLKASKYLKLEQIIASGPGIIDLCRDTFATIWNPLIATLSVSFESAEDQETLTRVLSGFTLCGTIAARYKLSEVLDYLIIYLCKASFLPLPPTIQHPIYSFGINKKAHRAAITAFTLAKNHALYLRESWPNVFSAMAALHTMDLLTDIPDMPDFQIPAEQQQQQQNHVHHKRTNNSQQQQSQSQQRQGWLSALWWGSDQTEEEAKPTQEMVEAQNNAKKCAEECHVFEVIEKFKHIDDQSLAYVLKALVLTSTIDQTTTANTITASEEESAVFCLDVLSKVVFLNSHRLSVVWPVVFEHLSKILTSVSAAAASSQTGAVVRGGIHSERAAADLLLLCINLCNSTEIQRDFATILWTLAGLPQNVMFEVIDAISLGLLELVKTPQARLSASKSGALSPLFTLIRAISITRRGASRGFEALVIAVESEIPLSVDEYALCIGAISHYARQSRGGARSDNTVYEADHDDDNDNDDNYLYEDIKKRDPKKYRERLRALDSVALRCIELLHMLFFKVTTWELCSQPIAILSELCRDTSPEVRHASLASLQRLLLSSILDSIPSPIQQQQKQSQSQTQTQLQSQLQLQQQEISSNWAVATALRRVVFPLMSDLLRPLSGGKNAANETRLRCCSLLTKYVLQHLPQLSTHSEFVIIWADLLGYIEQYMVFARARQTASDILSEALPELMKNLLMVMASTSIFDLKTDKGKELWVLTCRNVDKVFPGITNDITAKLITQSQSQSQQQQATSIQQQPITTSPPKAPPPPPTTMSL